MLASTKIDLRTDPERHVVQFYREPEFLRSTVGAWIGPALRSGRGALLACTPGHAQLVRATLMEQGIDVASLEATGHFVVLDAEELMARFMIDGAPHGATFKRLARSYLNSIESVSRGPVQVWGEMVDLLTKRGDHAGAHRLESLWNEISDEQEIRLLCSYQLDHLDPTIHADVLTRICTTHQTLLAEENPPTLAAALTTALAEEFGQADADLLQRVLPPRRALLDHMPRAVAALLSLRMIHPELGERVVRSMRANLGLAAGASPRQAPMQPSPR